MCGRKISIVALLLFAGASVALACGPFFPWQLLDDRTATLRATPKNGFVYEVSHFVPAPGDHLKAVEPVPSETDPDRAPERATAEAQGLSPDQVDRIALMRVAADDAAAYAAGEGLPEAIRLYTAGAADFHKTDLDHAAQRFAAVIALPAGERRSRAVWAAYMAGETAALANDPAKAAAMFALARRLAIAGSPDPLGLAVASFGEEGKLHYDRANGELVAPATPPPASVAPDGTAQPVPVNPTLAGYSLPPGNAAVFRSEMGAAAALYAQQAAHDSNSGVQSLRMIAEDVLADPDRIAATVPQPLVQRLLVVYALARLEDRPAQDQGINDAGTRERGVTLNPALPPLVDAIEKSGGANPPAADRLAALCYRVGRYDLASRLAAKSASPLAEWVKAKMSLQKGDVAAAAQHYAAASKGFPQAGATSSLDSGNADRIIGEKGVLALARGEYVDALDTLYPVAETYWGDVAYIADRVLTVDELKTFVDTKVPAPAQQPPAPTEFWMSSSPPVQLRNLLARRLMREGRYEEAFGYFGDSKIQGEARAYAAALHDANSDWGRVDRAEAFFNAAVIARESGMDILGTEVAPDYYVLGGSFDFGMGQDKPSGLYVTADEHARAAASAPKPDLRFDYRYIAVDEASRAADLLPPRSQAFAAVLCRADGWMMETSGAQARVKAIYHRYVKQGARVPWAKKFGRDCAAPDFPRAIALERHQMYRATRHYVSMHRWWFVGVGLVVLAGAAAAGFFAMRRKPQPS